MYTNVSQIVRWPLFFRLGCRALHKCGENGEPLSASTNYHHVGDLTFDFGLEAFRQTSNPRASFLFDCHISIIRLHWPALACCALQALITPSKPSI